MHEPYERLLIAAHGTASAEGMATLRDIAAQVAAARPDHEVGVCFLDVATPDLRSALDPRPTVIVPALLSTGYHVQVDIPAVAADFPRTRTARHLGPHPLLVAALMDRLGVSAPEGTQTVLAASGSSRPDAAADLAEQARLLAGLLRRPVRTLTLGPGHDARLAEFDAPVQVATYLLAEGSFFETLRAGVHGHPAGGTVAPPLGSHPAVVELVWHRYDSARRGEDTTR